jgi:hypothetical protein
MPAMNVRRSMFVPTRSGPLSIETPGRSYAILASSLASEKDST